MRQKRVIPAVAERDGPVVKPKLDQAEKDVLDRMLSRVATHAPPPGCDLDAVYEAWPDPSGREYIDAVYRPKPIDTLLSDDLILRRQWFLVSLPHVVTAEDAADIVTRAEAAGLLDGFAVERGEDFLGLSRRKPSRLARFAAEWLAPQLAEAPVACTAELLLARAAIQEGRRMAGVWPPAFIHPDQRPAIEVELALLSLADKGFDWVRSKTGPVVFRSAELAKQAPGAGPRASDKALRQKLKDAEDAIARLEAENRRLEELIADAGESDDGDLMGRFKRLYREHVMAYHPDRLSDRPAMDRKVGEEVTRVLNALYQDIKN